MRFSRSEIFPWHSRLRPFPAPGRLSCYPTISASHVLLGQLASNSYSFTWPDGCRFQIETRYPQIMKFQDALYQNACLNTKDLCSKMLWPERVDKFIVKSNITSNKLQGFETVSRGSRHRSNHTQKIILSVVAGHQFLQFGCIGQDTGLFPTTKIVMHLGFSLKTLFR